MKIFENQLSLDKVRDKNRVVPFFSGYGVVGLIWFITRTLSRKYRIGGETFSTCFVHAWYDFSGTSSRSLLEQRNRNSKPSKLNKVFILSSMLTNKWKNGQHSTCEHTSAISWISNTSSASIKTRTLIKYKWRHKILRMIRNITGRQISRSLSLSLCLCVCVCLWYAVFLWCLIRSNNPRR